MKRFSLLFVALLFVALVVVGSAPSKVYSQIRDEEITLYPRSGFGAKMPCVYLCGIITHFWRSAFVFPFLDLASAGIIGRRLTVVKMSRPTITALIARSTPSSAVLPGCCALQYQALFAARPTPRVVLL